MACATAPAASVTEARPRVSTVVRADKKTGRLVRSVVISPKITLPKPADRGSSGVANPNAGLDELVEEAARNYNLDPLLVHSVIKAESNYNPFALSHKGAEGLMQLVPATARRMGVSDSFNAKENIEGGVRYLKYLLTLFGDDRLALAAYNAGEGAVARYGWIPPYRETQEYVRRVGKHYNEARRAADVQKSPATPVVADPSEEQHPTLEMYQDEQGRLYFRTK